MAEMLMMLRDVVLYCLVFTCVVNARVVEVNERFGEQYKQGKWLVMFYAPWCGHCKKLGPVFHDVGNTLKNTDVVVAKMDATRYSMVASEFEVRGYPTIKLFSNGDVHTFYGERSKDDIVEFVKKAKGPAVRPLASIGRFNEANTQHSEDVFFMYVGDNDPDNDLFKKYSSVANEQVAVAYFYSGTKSALPQHITVKSYPTVLVFKDKTVHEYEAPRGVATMSSLQQWIKGEKFRAFPLVAGGNINQMTDTGKLLVIFIINERELENKQLKDLNERIKHVGKHMAEGERNKYHTYFQFLWMDDPETANNIMLTFIKMPYIMVLDPTLHVFYVPNIDLNKLDSNILGSFLEDIKSGKIQPLGGTGFFQRLKRVFYELLVTVIENIVGKEESACDKLKQSNILSSRKGLKRIFYELLLTVKSVWESSTWLFLIMFGLPTAVISIVCYGLCCMDTIDEPIHDSDEESDSDEEYRRYVQEQERHKQLESTNNEQAEESHMKSE